MHKEEDGLLAEASSEIAKVHTHTAYCAFVHMGYVAGGH